jgi:hypothetical protein
MDADQVQATAKQRQQQEQQRNKSNGNDSMNDLYADTAWENTGTHRPTGYRT